MLGNGQTDTHSDNRTSVFYVVRATNSDTLHVSSVGSDPRLDNESLLVLGELENWNWEIRGFKRVGIQWRTTEYSRMRVQF
jgi:hypothetical protein